ncbi:hypothetical protein ACFOYU_12520 [Microvirga sp. GCM10011540]
MRANRRLAQLWLDALATELGASAGTLDTYGQPPQVVRRVARREEDVAA